MTVHSKVPTRNRLAKVLPEEWRELLLAKGAPKRKYTVVARVELLGGKVIEDLIIEEGWIIATSKDRLGGIFEERIDFNPRHIISMEVKQII